MVPASAQFLNDNFFVLHCHCFVLNKLLCLVRESKAYICLPALVCVYAHITYLSSICTYTDSDGKSCMYVIKISMKWKIKSHYIGYYNCQLFKPQVNLKICFLESSLCGSIRTSVWVRVHVCARVHTYMQIVCVVCFGGGCRRCRHSPPTKHVVACKCLARPRFDLNFTNCWRKYERSYLLTFNVNTAFDVVVVC